ncbi:MAG: hypothetical protein HRT88_06230, partial [Lentisphaeraceae bacterium]|nr:hypothetical protein [Lentisphaeraceae bacterium]
MKYKLINKNTCSHGHDHAPKKDDTDEHCYYKGGPLSNELFSHLPFSVLSATGGIIFAGLICFMTPDSIMERA